MLFRVCFCSLLLISLFGCPSSPGGSPPDGGNADGSADGSSNGSSDGHHGTDAGFSDGTTDGTVTPDAGESDGTTDGTSTADAGVSDGTSDGTSTADAGVSDGTSDGTSTADSGVSDGTSDGSVIVDAGASDGSGDGSAVDAGAMWIDAGTPELDAGGSGDAGWAAPVGALEVDTAGTFEPFTSHWHGFGYDHLPYVIKNIDELDGGSIAEDVDLLRALRPSVLRFPGGNHSNFVHLYQAPCDYSVNACGPTPTDCLGSQDPDGLVVGQPGSTYYDSVNNRCYMNLKCAHSTGACRTVAGGAAEALSDCIDLSFDNGQSPAGVIWAQENATYYDGLNYVCYRNTSAGGGSTWQEWGETEMGPENNQWDLLTGTGDPTQLALAYGYRGGPSRGWGPSELERDRPEEQRDYETIGPSTSGYKSMARERRYIDKPATNVNSVTTSFAEDFVEWVNVLTAQGETVEVLLVANVLTGTTDETLAMIDYFIEAGLTIAGVELGSELYGGVNGAILERSYETGDPEAEIPLGNYFSIGDEKGLIEQFSEVIRANYSQIPIGVVAAPTGHHTEPYPRSKRFYDRWNDALVEHQHLFDAAILHLYTHIKDCDVHIDDYVKAQGVNSTRNLDDPVPENILQKSFECGLNSLNHFISPPQDTTWHTDYPISQWGAETGGAGATGDDVVHDMAFDAMGRLIVVGGTTSAMDGIDAQGEDAFVGLWDAQGVHQWNLQLHQNALGDEALHAVAITQNGDLVVAGITTGDLAETNGGSGTTDIIVGKVSSSGVLIWLQQLGSISGPGDSAGNEWVTEVALDASGNIYIVGSSDGDFADTNAGLQDGIWVKLSPEGALLQSRHLGAAGTDKIAGVKILEDGSFIVAGTTTGALEAGETVGVGADAFVAKVDATGQTQWLTQLGANSVAAPQGEDLGNENVVAIVVDHEHNIYIGGDTDGYMGEANGEGPDDNPTRDVFLASLNADGQLRWISQIGDDTAAVKNNNGNEEAKGLALDGKGLLYIAGGTDADLIERSGGGVQDAFVSQFGVDGIYHWTAQLGDATVGAPAAGWDSAMNIGVDGAGRIFIAGNTDGDLGETNGGGSDVFVAQIDPRNYRSVLEHLGTRLGFDKDVWITEWNVSHQGHGYYSNTLLQAMYISRFIFESAMLPEPNPLGFLSFYVLTNFGTIYALFNEPQTWQGEDPNAYADTQSGMIKRAPYGVWEALAPLYRESYRPFRVPAPHEGVVAYGAHQGETDAMILVLLNPTENSVVLPGIFVDQTQIQTIAKSTTLLGDGLYAGVGLMGYSDTRFQMQTEIEENQDASSWIIPPWSMQILEVSAP